MTSAIDSLTIRNYTDLEGLAKLRLAAGRNEAGSANEAARQFEALFIQMMLKSMRETTGGDSLLDGAHTQLYQDMFDQQISMDIARGQGLGLAPIIARQLGAQTADAPALESHAASASAMPRWNDPADYVRAVWPHAERAARRLGVAPEVLVAQSALETGWGKRLPTDQSGRSSHNVFGIKADHSWTGARVHVPTLEFEDGAAVRRFAAFRAYESVAASFEDYAQFVRDNPRYHEALKQGGDGENYVRELQAAGYATDPQYADEIIELMRSPRLQSASADLKLNAEPPLS